MSARSTQLKLVGGAGAAAALAVTTLASPALAASKNFDYTCANLGVTSVTYDAGTLPTSMAAGQSLTQPATLTVHLVEAQVDAAENTFFASKVAGTAANAAASDPLAYAFTLTPTTLPVPAADTDISAPGTETLHPTKVGPWDVAPGDMAANLVLTTPGGDSNAPIGCLAPTDGSNTVGTINVVKDTTTSRLSHTYSAKRHIVGGTATVKSRYGLPATGKVTFTLAKKGSKARKVVASVKNGKAKASFKRVTKAGKYTLSASYGGNAALKGSKAKANTFRVK